MFSLTRAAPNDVATVCRLAMARLLMDRTSIGKPWYRPSLMVVGLWCLPGVRREWRVVQDAMQGY
jgi:hypothetical protein